MDSIVMQAMLDADEHHWWYRGRRRVIAAELDRLGLAPGIEILDAGCGSGRTLQELVRYGRVAGVELNEQAAEIARGRALGEIRVGRLEALPWPDESFELITCLDVLEHTPDDAETLAELRRVARPGGRLLLTVPAYPTLWSRHDEANHHYRRYSRAALRLAAGSGGWNVERMSSFNGLLLAPAAAVRILERRRAPPETYRDELAYGPRWLNGTLEWPLRLEAGWLSRGRTIPAGLSLLAVLRRP